MAGKKISRANLARIQQIADHAHAMGAKGPAPDATPIKAMSLGDQIEAVARAVLRADDADGFCYVEDVFDASVIIEVSTQGGCSYWQASYTIGDDGVSLAPRAEWTQVEEVWQPVTNQSKAGLPMDGDSLGGYATMKAVGDRLLEVTVAYGGPKGGKDAHGEYFSTKTDFDPENFPTPPLLYYHGYNEQSRKMPKPVVTGKLLARRSAPHGHVLTYQLKSGKYADLQWEAAQAAKCAVSPGTVGHLIRKDTSTGELLYWPLAEVSAWDVAPDRQPANLYSIGLPALKAHYLEAGITLPDTLAPTPEAAGDAAGSSGHADSTPPLTPDEMRTIAAQIVTEQLRTYRKETTR